MPLYNCKRYNIHYVVTSYHEGFVVYSDLSTHYTQYSLYSILIILSTHYTQYSLVLSTKYPSYTQYSLYSVLTLYKNVTDAHYIIGDSCCSVPQLKKQRIISML